MSERESESESERERERERQRGIERELLFIRVVFLSTFSTEQRLKSRRQEAGLRLYSRGSYSQPLRLPSSHTRTYTCEISIEERAKVC